MSRGLGDVYKRQLLRRIIPVLNVKACPHRRFIRKLADFQRDVSAIDPKPEPSKNTSLNIAFIYIL